MATALKSKPGLTGATALSIPATWDATWFRHFIHNMLKGADVRNAVGAGGVTVTGNISSPYATIGFNGSTGLVITDGTHTVNGVTSIQFSGAVVSGVSPNGVVTISASGGVTSVTGTVNEIVATPTTGAVVLSFAPNVVIPAPASGTALTINQATGQIALSLTDGTVTTDYYSSGSSTVANLGTVSNHPLNIVTNSVARLSIAAAGNVSIAAPSSGTTLTIDGVAAGDPHVLILAGDTSGSTRSFDIVRNGAYNIFNVFNNGSFTFGGAGGTTLSGSAAGNITIAAPSSGDALTINGVASANTITLNATTGTGGIVQHAIVTPTLVMNSTGTDYGQIFNSATQVWALGYGPTTTANGTAALTWNATGNITIPAPSSGQAFNVTGSSGAYTTLLQGSSVSGSSYGLNISAGATSADGPLFVFDKGGSNHLFSVYGDGGVVVGAPTGGDQGLGTVNATGYYLNGVLLATPTTGTSSQSATGFAATVPTVTLAYTIVGKSVTLYIPAISGTSNSGAFGVNIPAAITPATTKNTAIPLYGWTNGGASVNIVGAGAQVNSAGTIAFFITGSGVGWTSSSTKASPAMSITYDLT